MNGVAKWIMRVAVAVVVAVAAVAVNPNPAPATPPIGCYDPPNVGECPPLDDQDCFVECKESGYANGGACMWLGSGCCACFM